MVIYRDSLDLMAGEMFRKTPMPIRDWKAALNRFAIEFEGEVSHVAFYPLTQTTLQTPPSYQTILRKHLNESQYLTLQLLLLLLQTHRSVKLSVLASAFPQPIQYQSRKRNLQRFLVLPQVCVKLL
jgi:hypothetical protein